MFPLTTRFLFRKNEGNGQFSVMPYKGKPRVHLRNDDSDIKVFNQVFDLAEYNIEIDFDPKVIVDCGANIGLTTVYFANKYPNATIISIEPEQHNFELLKKNTKDYPQVHLLNRGIWNRTTNLEIEDTGYGSWAFTVKEVDYENAHTLKAISIDEVMKLHNIDRIDILKMDIESSEKEVFEKNSELWLPKVRVLLVELHDRMKKGCSKSVFAALNNYEYTLRQWEETMMISFESML